MGENRLDVMLKLAGFIKLDPNNICYLVGYIFIVTLKKTNREKFVILLIEKSGIEL